jgi:ribonuclease Z
MEERSFAFCSDTVYSESIIPFIHGVDLLYHESTFLHEMVHLAEETMHSTAKQAATIAKKANVGQLIIGHYSSRYKDLSPLLDEAQKKFPNTVLGIEGKTIAVDYKKQTTIDQ